MPRIAIDYTPAHEQGAGIGRYVRDLTSALARLDKETDYRLFVAAATYSDLPINLGDNFIWKPSRISPKWFARIWHRFHLPLPVEQFTGRVDLFHATDFVLPPTLPNTKTLLTVHDLSFVRVPETTSPSLKAYLDRVVPHSVRKANHVLADSQATKNDLIDIYDIKPEKITVLLSGIDPRFKPLLSDLLTIRSKYSFHERPYIFAVGTVQPRKNYIRLIRALRQLRHQNYDIGLVIAGGRGWLDNPIYSAIKETKMEDYVHLIGFADDEDLPALYSNALCVAFPSLYEGFGYPVLEGMACGTPVITSNVSSLPELAGDSAIMVDPYDVDAIADAIKRVIDDSYLRENLVKKGFERIKSFNWDNSALQLRMIYDDLLNGKLTEQL